jgi:hypothetical protein
MPILGIVASSTRQGQATDTGSYFPLGAVTVGSAGASSITFSSIPSTYKHLQIRGIIRQSAVGFDQALAQFNSDTGNNYSRHNLLGDGSTASAESGVSVNKVSFAVIPGSNQSASVFGATVVDILDYANTNKYKTTRTLAGVDNNGSGYDWFSSGLWQNTAAITTITITPGSGNFVQYTQLALYGIKGA